MTPHQNALDVAMTWCHLTGSAEAVKLDDLLTDESVVHGLIRAPLQGIAAIQRAVDELAYYFPGKSCELLDGMMQGDHAAVRWTMTFPRKPWHGKGKPTRFDGLTMCTVRDGRIVELHTRFGRWWV